MLFQCGNEEVFRVTTSRTQALGFLWMTVGIIFGHLLQGLWGRQKSIGLAIGNVLGVVKIVKATISEPAAQIAEDCSIDNVYIITDD